MPLVASAAPEAIAPPKKSPGAPLEDSWSDPSKMRQMSAGVVLLWLLVPVLLCVGYGFYMAALGE